MKLSAPTPAWSAGACSRFRTGSLLPVQGIASRRTTLARFKAAASRRTPEALRRGELRLRISETRISETPHQNRIRVNRSFFPPVPFRRKKVDRLSSRLSPFPPVEAGAI